MNREDRRRVARLRLRRQRPLCPPGEHAFGAVIATVDGKEAVKRVLCRKCQRTFQQVMEQSPKDLAIYRAWLEDELAKARAAHIRECPRRHDLKAEAVDGCAGCQREVVLEHSKPENLGA